jgi:hypothetical protein
VKPIEAETDLIALNAMVYQLAGFPVGIGSFVPGSACFPAELQGLALDDLIGLILAISALQRDPLQPQQPTITDLRTAQLVGCEAAHLLGNWPSGFHDRLRALLPNSDSDRNAVTFRGVYGDFYQFLLDAAHHGHFKFLIKAFGDFVARDWPGVIRGQHRLLPQSVRDELRWIPAHQAARLAGLTARQITDLARNGKLTGIFVSPPRSRGRIECWLDREELAQWIVKRDSDLAGFISQAEAMKLLGLTAATFGSLAHSGLIEMLKGPDRGFPPGVHIRRQHVERILDAFSSCTSDKTASIEDKVILLREAMRRYLGREGFSEFIRHVLSGAVRPVARNPAVAGILGFIFRISDVKPYVPAKPGISVPSGFLTYATAAAALKTSTEVVRNLAANGLLQSSRDSAGKIKLLRARDVEDFASRYVALKSIAERFDVGSRTVSETLKQKGAEVLVISLPGKGNKLFARKGPKLDLSIRDVSAFKRLRGSL